MRTRGQGQKELERDQQHSTSSPNITYVLITGANAGLGLATCKRLIDEFIATRPATQTIHLIITTRSTTKSNATLDSLRKHIHNNAALKAASDRIGLSAHEVDLTKLRTVIALAETLRKTYPHLNTVICNAGIMGVEGLYWPQAIRDVLTSLVKSTTWPQYEKHSLGSLTRPQIDVKQGTGAEEKEPPLGDVFTANVFGHYLLVAHVSALLSQTPDGAPPGRVVWISSVVTYAAAFRISDIQCLERREAYSSSKRLTDILVLTSNLTSTQSSTDRFLSVSASTRSKKPSMYAAHPGVAATGIIDLLLPLQWAMVAFFYLARWLGSPWHTISTYKGAVSAVWLALAPESTLSTLEEWDGKGKWGSAVDMGGNERVMRTNVDGWGYGGIVGREAQYSRKGRRDDAVDLTAKMREEFEELGVKAWESMEALREQWEARLAN